MLSLPRRPDRQRARRVEGPPQNQTDFLLKAFSTGSAPGSAPTWAGLGGLARARLSVKPLPGPRSLRAPPAAASLSPPRVKPGVGDKAVDKGQRQRARSLPSECRAGAPPAEGGKFSAGAHVRAESSRVLLGHLHMCSNVHLCDSNIV